MIWNNCFSDNTILWISKDVRNNPQETCNNISSMNVDWSRTIFPSTPEVDCDGFSPLGQGVYFPGNPASWERSWVEISCSALLSHSLPTSSLPSNLLQRANFSAADFAPAAQLCGDASLITGQIITEQAATAQAWWGITGRNNCPVFCRNFFLSGFNPIP